MRVCVCVCLSSLVFKCTCSKNPPASCASIVATLRSGCRGTEIRAEEASRAEPPYLGPSLDQGEGRTQGGAQK